MPRWVASVTLAAITVGAGRGSAHAAPRSEVRGEVSVREVEISVALPDDLSPFKVGALEAQDFIVLRDGKEQEVVRAERVVSKDRAWTHVVWVDRVLASPQSILHTVLSLAASTPALVRLGAVDVVVADPLPRLQSTGGTETPAVHRALEEAAQAHSAASGASWSAPNNAALRRQSDRIVAWVASRRAVGPRTFWLPLEGMDLSLPAITELGGRAAPGTTLSPNETERVAILTDLMRALAAYGWTTLVMIDRVASGPSGAPGVEGDYDRWHRNLPDHGRGGSTSGALALRWPPRSHESDFDPRTLDAILDPRFAAPRLVAEETGGWMLAGPWDLGPSFDALARRWRVWMHAPESTDSELHAVAVKLRRGSELRASRWLRAATPAMVVEARLRAALGGERPTASTALAVRGHRLADGSVVLETPESATAPGAWRAWRWLAAVELADGAVVFPAVKAEAREGTWRLRLAVPPGTRSLALSRDDPGSGGYAIAVLEPPSAE